MCTQPRELIQYGYRPAWAGPASRAPPWAGWVWAIRFRSSAEFDKKVEELFKEFESDGDTETHSPQSHGFFDKVRELWDDLKE